MARAKTPRERDPLIALRIPPLLDKRLRDESETSGLSISEIVRSAIEARLRVGWQLPTATRREANPHRKGTATGVCEHRVRPGAYCKRCERVIA